MFIGVGVGAFSAGVFHLVTHAFFKACLFLGSGSVIHGMHDEQDMRRMGNLRKYMPITAGTFIVGWLAIAGVPPFAGFWSKDEILLFAYDKSPILWAIGLVTALLTAFYMSRQVFLVFFGDERWHESLDAEHAAADAHAVTDEEQATESEADVRADNGPDPVPAAADHGDAHADPHESPWHMTLPLVALAGLALVGGALNLPFTHNLKLLERWLEPVLEGNERAIDVASGTKVGLAAIAIVVALLGIGAAVAIYLQRRRAPIEPEILAEGWRYDSTLSAFVDGPGRAAFEGAAAFDRNVVDGAVNGVAALVQAAGKGLRRTQTGYVRTYALGVGAGVVCLLAYFLTRIL
jgi:NADH-quinone oxidoreductase subunit L